MLRLLMRLIVGGLFLSLVVGIAANQEAVGQTYRKFKYSPAPVDNPLKGLVPYQGDVREYFPHSLEFNYLPYSALVKGYNSFDWAPLEQLLNDIASRGHQAIVRIFLEYPGRKEVIPNFLIEDGLKVHKWLYTERQPLPPAAIETPDYEDTNLRRSLQQFIAAFGERYDGDPRLGFITAGLLGTWGEWHNYPKDNLFASKQVQLEVMKAYERAFSTTPVLLRYPTGEDHYQKAPNANRRFGYHDDSFAWATLETGREEDDWFFMSAMKTAGSEALQKWKRFPIGGEIRPEAWGIVFDEQPSLSEVQDFRECVEATHVTWLMDSGMFDERQPSHRIKRAEEQVRRMGYEFFARSVAVSVPKAGLLKVKLEIENRGVAPFYYDWSSQWVILFGKRPVMTIPASGKIVGLLPGDQPRVWADELDIRALKPGGYSLAVRVINPLKGGKPLRFANEEQLESGLLQLADFTVP